MNELIKITKNEEGQQLVSARELHEFLEVGRDFTTWIKGRIYKYGFVENIDFTIIESFHQNGGKGGRPEHDYVITIDMAKELSMVENNDKGRQARQYFIDCEKKLKQLTIDSYMIQDPIERAKAWIKEEEERKRLREENKKLIPKAEFYDLVANTDDWSSMKEVANILNRGIGSNTLFRILRDKKILITGGSNHNYPYQQYINRGYFKVIETNKVVRGEIKKKTVVSQKGIKFINKVLDEV